MTLGCRHCRRSSFECNCPKGVSTREPIVALRDAEATIRSTSDRTRMRLLRLVLDNERWDRIVELGVMRATSEGARIYGDTSYHKSDIDLEYEGDCELADWTFYEGVIVERQP